MLSEKKLLDGYFDIARCGSNMSKVENDVIYWEYRTHNGTMCQRERADRITINDNGYVIKEPIGIDKTCCDHPSLRKLAEATNTIYASYELGCTRCGHTWIPRSPNKPKYCPCCNSPYWDQPRRVTVSKIVRKSD